MNFASDVSAGLFFTHKVIQVSSFFLHFGRNVPIKWKTIFIHSHITYAVFPDFLNVTFLYTDPENNSRNIVINMNSRESIQQTKSSVY